MSHNYRLTDFKIVGNDAINLNTNIISIDFKKAELVPESIVPRLEHMLNEIIWQLKKSLPIPIDCMEIDMYVSSNSFRRLELNVYIAYWYKGDVDSIMKTEIIGKDDEDYTVIKNFFMEGIRNYVSERLSIIDRNV